MINIFNHLPFPLSSSPPNCLDLVSSFSEMFGLGFSVWFDISSSQAFPSGYPPTLLTGLAGCLAAVLVSPPLDASCFVLSALFSPCPKLKTSFQELACIN